jgi:cystathionine beta-lyase family protein involved in aluminum resistance
VKVTVGTEAATPNATSSPPATGTHVLPGSGPGGAAFFQTVARLWSIPVALADLAEQAEALTARRRAFWRERSEVAFLRVLRLFQEAGVTEAHLAGTTGYGYGDLGRDVLDTIYARLFEAEAALVRSQIVSGTHALSLCLRAAVEPSDVLVSGTGAPYDTLRPQIAELKTRGARCFEVPLGRSRRVGPDIVAAAVGEAAIAVRGRGKVCLFLQRSRGYDPGPSRDVSLLGEIIARSREEAATNGVELVAVVDNCYGELVEDREPTAVGADLAGGSLIKNLGGGLAPCGGYVVGRAALVNRAADLLTAPGLGGKCGATLGVNRLFYQGLLLAPRVVGAALAGATFAAALFEKLGFAVAPSWDDERTDIIQCVRLPNKEAVLAFARGIQASAPVDSMARPEPALLPGYADEVIMAAGTFVQGASIELSLDAPLRPPYAVYLQGGLDEAHLKVASLVAAAELERAGLSIPRSAEDDPAERSGGVVAPTGSE